MHNNIMAAGLRDRLPMLATRRYAQWRSRFLQYIDTRPNGNALRKCILEGPYTLSTVVVLAVPATENSPAVPEHTTVKKLQTVSPENKAHYESEKEAIHLILTGIRDEIYSTVDACKTAQEMWEAIERLQQGESLNIQDFGNQRKMTIAGARENVGSLVVQQTGIQYFNYKEFGHFAKECRNPKGLKTLHITRKRCCCANKLRKPEWSRFVTIVKQQHKLDEVSYHKFFDTLKQYQNEDNELCAERLARNANPLALVAIAQVDQDPYYQTSRKPKRVKDSAYHKEKMLLSKQAEQGVPLQAEHYDWLADTDEEVNEQELEAHYSYMAKIHKVPTADTGTDSEQLEQVQNDDGYNVFSNDLQYSEQSESVSNTCLVETDDSYMEKIQEVPTADSGTDSEPLEQVQYDVGYNVFSNEIQHYEQSKSIRNICVVEMDDSNVIPDSPDLCDNDIQNEKNVVESDDERVALANLIANLKLDVDEIKRFKIN
nr:hypothetical protein [Tanacetum cinerariifolium]